MSQPTAQASLRSRKQQIEANFSDLHPPLGASEAVIEADRCYFCFDAPCTEACPTGIDVATFIQKIRSGNVKGSAQTILSENIMGAMCARVCPTEVLCEQACVRNTHEGKPVEIGLLQRFATDGVIDEQLQFFDRATSTGKHIAIIGAGPAGLSCAHRLAVLGHQATIFEARGKPAGLNEYGIAAYKATDAIAQKEAEYIIAIQGIELKTNMQLGKDIQFDQLREQYNAVFFAAGLNAVNALGLDDEDIAGVGDAVEYIERLRQTEDKSKLVIGQNVIVIGGGMTAIDIAIQAKLLGAQDVTLVYRRGQEAMPASEFEQRLAQTHNVNFKLWSAPHRVLIENGKLSGMEFERMEQGESGLSGTGDFFSLSADQVFKAIGQKLVPEVLGDGEKLTIERGRIVVDDERRTSLDDVWAGGDCVLGGDNLTVSAVQDGKLAAISIDQTLRQVEAS
jgi:glutamate synthase (NADPH/NADH) small chain